MKPDFQAMSQAELRAYVIAHPQDDGAFEALADRAYANANPEWYQPQDLSRFPELLERDIAIKSMTVNGESTT
jgi:hypothetical protein